MFCLFTFHHKTLGQKKMSYPSIALSSFSTEKLPITQPLAWTSTIILSSINLLNYIDRFITSSTKELIIDDLNLTDTESSLPITSFMIVFMIFCPIFGMLADLKWDRKNMLMIGIGFFLLVLGFGIGFCFFWTLCPWC